MTQRIMGSIRLLAGCGLILSLGCNSLTSSITRDFSRDLSTAILDQTDPEIVRQGLPTLLIALDSRLVANPDDGALLLSASRLYSNYAANFVNDHDRVRVLSTKAKELGWRGFCSLNRSACGLWEAPYSEFEAHIDEFGATDVEALYVAASSWATWIQANRSDWSAIADKARVDKMIRRVIELDPDYEGGTPYAYLGVLATLLPEALGGQPEAGRGHFERAIEISGGHNLMFKVLLAEKYARLVFDRTLHDELCQQVLGAPAEYPELTLGNLLAKKKARQLLDGSKEFFGD